MSTAIRIAIVTGLLLLGGSLAAFLVPATAEGYGCGNVVAPEWDEEESRELAERTLETGEQALGFSQELANESLGIAAGIADAYRACSDSLGTRATIGWSLLAGAVVLPGAIVFVGRGARRS